MDQPFDCQCGTPVRHQRRPCLASALILSIFRQTCLGTIQGAKFLTTKELDARQWISPWILELVAERDGFDET